MKESMGEYMHNLIYLRRNRIDMNINLLTFYSDRSDKIPFPFTLKKVATSDLLDIMSDNHDIDEIYRQIHKSEMNIKAYKQVLADLRSKKTECSGNKSCQTKIDIFLSDRSMETIKKVVRLNIPLDDFRFQRIYLQFQNQ